MKFTLVALLLVAVACGDGDPEVEQSTYNGFLEIARRDVALNADTRCDPDTWDGFIESLGPGDDEEDRFIRLALMDACIEIRRLSGDYSDFHDNAPPR